VYYVILLIMFAAGIFFILARGSSLNAGRDNSRIGSATASPPPAVEIPAATTQIRDGQFIDLNLGYDLGILSARTFVMMVIMALVTTFMTMPLLSLLKLGKQT
jgi:hypothetical protein